MIIARLNVKISETSSTARSLNAFRSRTNFFSSSSLRSSSKKNYATKRYCAVEKIVVRQRASEGTDATEAEQLRKGRRIVASRNLLTSLPAPKASKRRWRGRYAAEPATLSPPGNRKYHPAVHPWPSGTVVSIICYQLRNKIAVRGRVVVDVVNGPPRVANCAAPFVANAAAGWKKRSPRAVLSPREIETPQEIRNQSMSQTSTTRERREGEKDGEGEGERRASA